MTGSAVWPAYMQRGNLQDEINRCVVEHTRIPEASVVQWFRELCGAVEHMHTHRVGDSTGDHTSEDTSMPLMQAESEYTAAQTPSGLMPFAHRDIKPGNVMIDRERNSVILMDFGSTVPARVSVQTRQQALEIQDEAAENSTMPYRAPELVSEDSETR